MMARLLIGALMASASIQGCRSDSGTTPAVPERPDAPAVESIAHGFETEDGRTTTYRVVDTGETTDPDAGKGGGDYSDRAVAK